MVCFTAVELIQIYFYLKYRKEHNMENQRWTMGHAVKHGEISCSVAARSIPPLPVTCPAHTGCPAGLSHSDLRRRYLCPCIPGPWNRLSRRRTEVGTEERSVGCSPREERWIFLETNIGLRFLEIWGGQQTAVWVSADGHRSASQGSPGHSGPERAVPGELLAFRALCRLEQAEASARHHGLLTRAASATVLPCPGNPRTTQGRRTRAPLPHTHT